MAHSANRGLVRLIRATGYSWKGFKAAFKHEEAFRQELLLLVMLAPVGIWLGQTAVQRVLLVCSLIAVLVVELLNSAVEAAIDRVGQEHHRLSGRAKDMGSAAVLLALICATLCWTLIAAERFL
ncbi:MAG: diacylglycerol kinase [Pseudomonadota bacterium]|nr:diacylglycerol kinase [Pseudomonadota bacterium]